MSNYLNEIEAVRESLNGKAEWGAINPEYVVRMRQQNRFHTGLDIAKYTAGIMRRDMAAYDADTSKYTQSLGAWHGFIAQQTMMSVKKRHGSTDRRYIYLSGWMVAALRSKFGPLPDQSMHEKTTVPELIEEIYTFLSRPMLGSCATCSRPSTRPGPQARTPRLSWSKSTTTRPT